MSRVWTKVVMEWSEAEQRYVTDESRSEWFDYNGPVAECKGGDTAKKQLDQQNALAKQQLDLENKKLQQIDSGVGKYLSGNEGFDPETLASIKSQFLNNNALDFSNAGSAVRDALAAKGQGNGDLPVGGTYTRGISGLMGAQASQHGAGLLNIGVANGQQALANKFNAASVLSGNAAVLGGNVGTFNAGATGALGDYIRAKNTGFLSSLSQGFGGALGGGLGKIVTGGLSGVLGGGGEKGPNG
jgi:hypothetical protein